MTQQKTPSDDGAILLKKATQVNLKLDQETKDFILSLRPKTHFKKSLWVTIIGCTTFLAFFAVILVAWHQSTAHGVQQKSSDLHSRRWSIE